MTVTLVKPTDDLDPTAIEQVLLGGDLSRLSTAQRLAYYKRTCESLGLNMLTRPFEYLVLNGKTLLYARKDATEQLRKVHAISVTIKARELVEGCYIVTANAKLPSGREDEAIGAVPIDGLKGESRSNAMMKAETKAKRRVTLSVCGLGMLDETEVDSVPGAAVVTGPENPAPDGFEVWWAGMEDVVPEGMPRYYAEWKMAKPEYREYAAKHCLAVHEGRKTRAGQADDARGNRA